MIQRIIASLFLVLPFVAGAQADRLGKVAAIVQGEIALDDPLTKYFPDAPESWRSITVRHLLTHTSGIPDWEGATDLTVAIDLRREYSEDELAHRAFKLALEFPPGSRWHYRNTG